MKKANAQKNTLLKNAQANAESNFFKRVFFSPTQEEIQIIFFPTLRFFNYLFFQRTVRNRTDIASNLNRFVDSVCGLETVVLRGESRAAGNKKINANFLFGGFIASYESWCVNEQLCFVSTVVRELPQIKNFVYPLCVSQKLPVHFFVSCRPGFSVEVLSQLNPALSGKGTR